MKIKMFAVLRETFYNGVSVQIEEREAKRSAVEELIKNFRCVFFVTRDISLQDMEGDLEGENAHGVHQTLSVRAVH